MLRRVFSKRDNRHVWQIDVTIAGQRIRHGGFATKEEADQALQEMKRRARAARYGLQIESHITLGDLLRERRADQTTSQKRVNVFEKFVEHLGPGTKVRSLARSDLITYQKRLLQERQPSTVNTQMGIIVSSLNSASHYFREFEDYRSPSVKTLKAKEGRDRVFSRQEIQALYSALLRRKARARNVADLFALLLLTGSRPGEILNLTRPQIDLNKSLVLIQATKTKTTRLIPLSPLAKQILERRMRGSGRIFNLTIQTIECALRKAAKETGITYGQNVPGGFVLYDCRHTAPSVLAEAGFNFAVEVELLGHSKKNRLGTTGIYTHISMQTLRAAVQCLEDYCQLRDGVAAGKAPSDPTLGQVVDEAMIA